jgi:catechol 2,3-dioxygenase-like lactoylglutathione lyase family enzyme
LQGVAFHRAIPILPCEDVDAAVAWFTDVLGFAVDFTWGTPTTYAAVERDDAEVHLLLDDGVASPGRVTVTLDGVDAYYEGLVARGADITVPLADRAYGLRDFAVRAPDGHLLTFGESLVD